MQLMQMHRKRSGRGETRIDFATFARFFSARSRLDSKAVDEEKERLLAVTSTGGATTDAERPSGGGSSPAPEPPQDARAATWRVDADGNPQGRSARRSAAKAASTKAASQPGSVSLEAVTSKDATYTEKARYIFDCIDAGARFKNAPRYRQRFASGAHARSHAELTRLLT